MASEERGTYTAAEIRAEFESLLRSKERDEADMPASAGASSSTAGAKQNLAATASSSSAGAAKLTSTRASRSSAGAGVLASAGASSSSARANKPAFAGASSSIARAEVPASAGASSLSTAPATEAAAGASLPDVTSTMKAASSTAPVSLKCVNCMDLCEKPLRCGICKEAVYCSHRCQKGDWPYHKRICKKEKGGKCMADVIEELAEDAIREAREDCSKPRSKKGKVDMSEEEAEIRAKFRSQVKEQMADDPKFKELVQDAVRGGQRAHDRFGNRKVPQFTPRSERETHPFFAKLIFILSILFFISYHVSDPFEERKKRRSIKSPKPKVAWRTDDPVESKLPKMSPEMAAASVAEDPTDTCNFDDGSCQTWK